MGQIDVLNLVVGLAGLVTVLFYRDRLADALREALHNFRGGPPGPMHPSPASDGFLLRRKRGNIEN